MAASPKQPDRRVQKTREVIRQAFVQVVAEKGLAGASVREVVERAHVSRGTFYAHYADKYELVDAIVREGFRQAVAAVPGDAGWNRDTLLRLVTAVLVYFKSNYQRHRGARDLTPLLERAVHEELQALVLALLKTAEQDVGRARLPLETMAPIISWTIYGAASQWSQTKEALPLEAMAQGVVVMVTDGVAPLGVRPTPGGG